MRRFPLALPAKIAGHIISHKLRKTLRFAMVLQLEPLHTCNPACTGCGRIREYSTSLKHSAPLEKCLAAPAACDAPMVSVCGGEPLIYPQIEELVNGLLALGRIVYICTNGLLMRRKLLDYVALRHDPSSDSSDRSDLSHLLAKGLISEKEAEAIRSAGPAAQSKPVIRPSRWLYWNVHLDRVEATHERVVERRCVFRECLAAIKLAKRLGFQVATNTTVYREAEMREIEDLLAFLSPLGVDGHTISPGYDFDAAKKDMLSRLGRKPEDFSSPAP